MFVITLSDYKIAQLLSLCNMEYFIKMGHKSCVNSKLTRGGAFWYTKYVGRLTGAHFLFGEMNMEVSYRVIRSARRTVAIQISPNGEVLVRCPSRMNERAVRSFVESKSDWIAKHLARQPHVQPLTPQEQKALTMQAKAELPKRVAHFAGRMGVSYGRITIRAQRTRWGSCSSKGNLNFNCLLMLAPPEVRDYVVVHELCHLKQMNHSPEFWAEVEGILPDYRASRQWLKANGPALTAKLP